MKVSELKWSEHKHDGDNKLYAAFDPDGNRFTVLDRVTGYGDGDIRDVETGYKDKNGKWWLRSGMFDIRDYPDLTLEEAAAKIKEQPYLQESDER